ncbi:MAG: Nif3-like dinuclear metal center hexameric protein [Betaproteobacteria bacterium]|nr:Nif3-like dinuclear metal center hexameric protein [Betaproteobacteria bacterium]
MPDDSVLREDLRADLDALLDAARFRDYCPNGLQVEGSERIGRIVCGVTASQALIEAAIERDADALLVHHGWFWKAEDARITGFRKRRMARLLAHDINLFAYHLPLDAHATLGNNAQFALRLGWTVTGRFGEQEIGFAGVPPAPTLAGELARQMGQVLGRAPMLIGDPAHRVERIAWCSGGAQGYFEGALATGADVFVSGEISEQTVHLARETGMAFIAAGHHATERYGVMALGAHMAQRFGIHCEFVDIDNPV